MYFASMLRLLCSAVLCCICLSAGQTGRIEKTEGTVEKIDGLGKKHPAARGITLKNGETLLTRNNSLAALRLGPAVTLELSEQSSAVLVATQKVHPIIQAQKGTLSFSVTPKSGSMLEVRTRYFLCTCSGGVFRFDLDSDQAVVSVSRGKISILDVETRAPKMEVLNGETAMIGAPFDQESGPAGPSAAGDPSSAASALKNP